MAPNSSLIRVSGTDIVNGDGKRIILKGVSYSISKRTEWTS